jgi:hypothetical protein
MVRGHEGGNRVFSNICSVHRVQPGLKKELRQYAMILLTFSVNHVYSPQFTLSDPTKDACAVLTLSGSPAWFRVTLKNITG